MISTAGPSLGDRGHRGVRSPAPSKAGARPSSVRRHRLPMRSSPYVGWFRHAPPSSLSSRRAPAPGTWVGVGRPRSHSFTGSGSSTGRYQALRRSSGAPPAPVPQAPVAAAASFFGGCRYPSSPGRMKSSPYVGWFRHAPPSRARVAQKAEKVGRDHREAFAEALEAALVGTSSSKSGALGGGHHRRYHVDGRLRGGCPLREEGGGCGGGEGIFPFDDEDGDAAANRLLDNHHRVLDSIHQSASTRGLHFNAFGQEDDHQDDDEEERTSSAVVPDKSSSDLLSSIGTDEDSFHGGGDGDGLPSSATVGVLNRLGHWFLSPLAHDLESPYEELARSSDAASALYGHVGPGATTALLPLFAGMLKRALLLEDGEAADPEDASLSSEEKYPWEGDEGRENRWGRAPSSEVVDSREEASPNDDAPPSPGDGGAPPAAPRPLPDSSVSSLAEAYYAHQASREFLEAAEQAGLSSSPPPSLASSPTGGAHHPLDYVITQIDIARMVRNASRHLDVESILSLPTVTYRGKREKEWDTKNTETARAGGETDDDCQECNEGEPLRRSAGHVAPTETPENGDDVAWSWMIVPSDPEGRSHEVPSSPPHHESNAAPPATSERWRPSSPEPVDDHDHDDVDERCVICLDHFQDGDVLRVLPCDHLFHAGCVDRWLSGSSSHEECFTAGCPTCKERPVRVYDRASASVTESPEGMTGAGAAAGAGGPGASTLWCGEEEGLLAGSRDCSGESEGASSPLDGSVPRWAFARLGNAMAGRA